MLDEDGLPLDEVGSWAKEKHDRLRSMSISRARLVVSGSAVQAGQRTSISIAASGAPSFETQVRRLMGACALHLSPLAMAECHFQK